ncbi:MAG: hypothetical protein AAF297_10340 [Planctomycetota bacterium]
MSRMADSGGSGPRGTSLTLRTLGVVTLVTLLTWLLAESQTLQRRTVSVPVMFDAGGDQRVLRVTDEAAWDGVVELTLGGAAANLDTVRRTVREGVVLAVGDELGSETGVRQIDLRAALSADAAFERAGVSIGEVTPERVELEIRSVEEVLVPVSVELPGDSQAEVTVVDPAAVLVRGPSTVVSGVGESVVVRVPAGVVSGLLPGQSAERVGLGVVVGGEFGAEGAWGLRVVPERVSVSVTVKSRVATAVLASVPVHLQLAPSEVDRWVIEVSPEDRDIRDVRVTGPAALVEQVAGGSIPLKAVVSLSFEELERGITVKDATLPVLPGDVRVEADDLSVGLTIRRREPGVG